MNWHCKVAKGGEAPPAPSTHGLGLTPSDAGGLLQRTSPALAHSSCFALHSKTKTLPEFSPWRRGNHGLRGNTECTLNIVHWTLGKRNFASSQPMGSAAGFKQVQLRLIPDKPHGLRSFQRLAKTNLGMADDACVCGPDPSWAQFYL